MLKNKSYYKKILNELIPKSKKNNFLSFCECVDIEKFFKNIELIDFKSYAIISKKKCSKKIVFEQMGVKALKPSLHYCRGGASGRWLRSKPYERGFRPPAGTQTARRVDSSPLNI